MPQTRTSLALTPAVIPLLQPRKLDYAMIKDAGFRNKNEFMLSYPITRQLSSYIIDKNLANQEAWVEYGSLVLYARAIYLSIT